MKLFNLYIFNFNGDNIFYKEWLPLKSNSTKENDTKLLRGMLVGLKAVCSSLSASETPINSLSYKTNKYKLHYFEGPTGIKIILNTDTTAPSLVTEMEQVYKIYVEYVIRAPNFDSGSSVNSPLFVQEVDALFQKLLNWPCVLLFSLINTWQYYLFLT